MAKSKLNATIDSGLFDSFEKYCKNNDKNRSALIERLIRKYLLDEGVLKEEKKKVKNG